jgi:hypothetical protein
MRDRASIVSGVAASLALLLAGAGVAAATVVERIEVEGADVVRFHLSEPSIPRVIGLPARLPVQARIAVDFYDATLGPDAREPVPGSGVIVRVRPEQLRNSETVRATVELTHPVGFMVESAGNVVTLHLKYAGAAPSRPAPSSDGKPADAPPES